MFKKILLYLCRFPLLKEVLTVPYYIFPKILRYLFLYDSRVENIFVTHPIYDIEPAHSDLDLAVQVRSEILLNSESILEISRKITFINKFLFILDEKSVFFFNNHILSDIAHNDGYYLACIYPPCNWLGVLKRNNFCVNISEVKLTPDLFHLFQRTVFFMATNNLTSSITRRETKAYTKVIKVLAATKEKQVTCREGKHLRLSYLNQFLYIFETYIKLFNCPFDISPEKYCIYENKDLRIFKIPNPFEDELKLIEMHNEYFVVLKTASIKDNHINLIKTLTPRGYKRIVLLPSMQSFKYYLFNFLFVVPTQLGYFLKEVPIEIIELCKPFVLRDQSREKTYRYAHDIESKDFDHFEMNKKIYKLISYRLLLQKNLFIYKAVEIKDYVSTHRHEFPTEIHEILLCDTQFNKKRLTQIYKSCLNFLLF